MPRLESENSVTNRSYWNSVWSGAPAGQEVLGEGEFYAGSNGLFVKLLNHHLGDLRRKSVVEFGGGGHNIRLLAMAKWLQANVTALDFSENGLHVVTELFRANDCNLRLIAADLTSWQPDEQFDVVVHWGVLEHFVDPCPLLEKSAAALKPGGTLLFSMPNMEALSARLWERWSPDNWQKHVMHSDDLVVRTLSDLGLTGVRAFHFGVPFFKMGPWERRSAMQVPISALQIFGSATARVLPIFHRFGWRSLSMERGFVARRAA